MVICHILLPTYFVLLMFILYECHTTSFQELLTGLLEEIADRLQIGRGKRRKDKFQGTRKMILNGSMC